MEDTNNNDQKVKEGFIGQKMFMVPKNIRHAIKKNSLINSLYFTDIGYYPQATNHFRERKRGCREYILIYCLEGEGWVQIDRKKHILKPNSYFIIPKGTAHSYGTVKNSCWSIYWIHFTGNQSDILFDKYQRDSLLQVVEIPFVERRIHVFDDIISLLESGYSIDNVEYTNICLWELFRSFVYSRQYHSETSYDASTDRMEQSIQYMRKNLDKPFHIEDIASHFHYSVSHYFTVFKKKTGYSPLHYFNQMKIQAACQYLSFTNMSVKEISFKLGFKDPLYFSRMFKKLMGISPIQYRNTYL